MTVNTRPHGANCRDRRRLCRGPDEGWKPAPTDRSLQGARGSARRCRMPTAQTPVPSAHAAALLLRQPEMQNPRIFRTTGSTGSAVGKMGAGCSFPRQHRMGTMLSSGYLEEPSFLWFAARGCGSSKGGVPSKCICPPGGGHSLANEITLARITWHGCDGGTEILFIPARRSGEVNLDISSAVYWPRSRTIFPASPILNDV